MAHDEELRELVRAAVSGGSGVSEKSMFGGHAFLIDGHMAVACSRGGGLLLRIDPDDTDRLVTTEPRASRFVMRGRELDGWLHIDLDATAGATEVARWVSMGVRFASSLPPKGRIGS